MKSVHATERATKEAFRGRAGSEVFKFQLLVQYVPGLVPDDKKVRAHIISLDQQIEVVYDADVWFSHNTLLGEPPGYIGFCVRQNGVYWHADALRGIPYYNDSGLTIPPYGAIQITAAGLPLGETVAVKQPDSDGVRHPGLILINSGYTIDPGAYGIASIAAQDVAKINIGDGAVIIGDDVGPKSGSFDLWARGKGFTLRAAAGAGLGIVEANDNVLEIVRVTSDEPDGLGFYDGVVQRYNPIALTWETLFTCKVLDANG